MAHIPDGILAAPVLIAGGAVAAAGVAIGLIRLAERDIPRAAILSAAFFALSLIAVPVGPSTIHLLLAGLMGVLLRSAMFPAVLAALLLQSVLFGFGGLTTLGVNTVNIALPAVLLGYLFGPAIARAAPSRAALLAGVASALAIAGTGAMVALSLAFSSPDYATSAKVMIATYVPLMLAEALVSGFCIAFIKRVKPEFLVRQTVHA